MEKRVVLNVTATPLIDPGTAVYLWADSACTIPAVMYGDDGVTPVVQPLLVDANGEFSYRAADGVYWEKIGTEPGIELTFQSSFVVTSLQPKLATSVDKGVSFNTSTLDDVTDCAKMFTCTAAITITLETYTDKPLDFQFGGTAGNGIVTIAGTYKRVSTFDKVPDGGMFYVIRKADGWHVGGVTT